MWVWVNGWTIPASFILLQVTSLSLPSNLNYYLSGHVCKLPDKQHRCIYMSTAAQNHSAKQTQCEKAVQNKNKNRLDSEQREQGTTLIRQNCSFLYSFIFIPFLKSKKMQYTVIHTLPFSLYEAYWEHYYNSDNKKIRGISYHKNETGNYVGGWCAMLFICPGC